MTVFSWLPPCTHVVPFLNKIASLPLKHPESATAENYNEKGLWLLKIVVQSLGNQEEKKLLTKVEAHIKGFAHGNFDIRHRAVVTQVRQADLRCFQWFSFQKPIHSKYMLVYATCLKSEISLPLVVNNKPLIGQKSHHRKSNTTANVFLS